MLPTHRDFQYDPEIDILENLGGKPDVIYQTYQYKDRQDAYKVNDIIRETNGKCPKLDYSGDFHTYGVDWQPDHIAFYIDGTECGRFTATDTSQITNEPMQIILALGVDTSGRGLPAWYCRHKQPPIMLTWTMCECGRHTNGAHA